MQRATIDPRRAWAAVSRRDPRWDERLVYTVETTGNLRGYRWGLERKRRLLRSEST